MPDKPKRVLLLGGAGYVGSVLSQYLLNKNYHVRCLDSLIYNNNYAVESLIGLPNYEFIRGDICDRKTLIESARDTDHVVILAGLVGDPITKKYPKISCNINEVGIQKSFEYLNGLGLNKIIFISTCSNYGFRSNSEPADEGSPLNPLSSYAKAKVSAEQKLLSMRGQADYCPTILRFATAFGLSPRMRFDLSVNEFTRELSLGKELIVFDPDTWRPYCHLQDFARLILSVIESENKKVFFEVFNAGSDSNNYTKRMLINEILNFLPKSRIKYLDNGNDPRNYRVNFEKVQNVIKFSPKYSVRDGIKEIVKCLENGIFMNLKDRKDGYGNFDVFYDSP